MQSSFRCQLARLLLCVLISHVFLPRGAFGQNSNLLNPPVLTLQTGSPGPERTDNWENARLEPGTEIQPLDDWIPKKLEGFGKWSFAFGVGIIGDTVPRDYFDLGFDRFGGPGQGLTYNLTAAYRLREFDWKVWQLRLQPQLEVPFMLTLVDENGEDPFPDYNVGLMFRWRDFPWNHYVYTTFGIGGGFSYTSRVWTADRARHPGDERSHLKFWMPVEFTFALPQHPRHQLMLFTDHQSGGLILDRGGIEAWGIGYRFQF